MLSRYPLFQSHIDLAHKLWTELVKEGDTVIDATCGNGHDTLILARLALSAENGTLYAMDSQIMAIDSTKQKLMGQLPENIFSKIKFIHGCHSSFPDEISNFNVSLIVYNLGYLPGGNKGFTTNTDTTLKSLKDALNLIKYGGMISITCYPGHPEGEKEENEILNFGKTLDPAIWSFCHFKLINRKKSPSLVIIQKYTGQGSNSE